MASSVIGRLSAILELDTAQFSAGVDRAQKRMSRLGRTMQRTGQNMTRSVSVPMAVAAGGAVKAFASFDTAMNESLAIMGDVSTAMRKDMAQAARTVAKEVTFSAKESAESFFFLASAGLDAKASIAALPVVSKFAQAGAFDMATATDLLTDAQSALGLAIKDDAVANMKNMVAVSDVLVKANTLANASVSQFSTALTSKAGAALKSFNIDIEEGVAVLAAFADQGVKAELAGNALDRILRLLPKAASSNAEAFRQFGIEVFDAQGNINNLGEIIGDLEGALEGMTDEQKFATLEMLGFEARVQAIIKPLLGTSDAIREYEAGLRQAGGTTNDVANKQMRAFGKRLGLIRDRIVDVSITIGETLAPTIISIGEKIAETAEAFASLSPSVQRTAIALAAAAAAAGPLLIALGLMASGLAVLTGAGGLIALTFIAFGTLGATLREQTNPAIKAAREAEEELQRVLNDTSSSDKAIEAAKSNAREKLKLAKAALAAAKAELELSAVQNDALGMDAFIGGTATQRRIIELEQTIKSLSGSLEESSQMFIRLGDNSVIASKKLKEMGDGANEAADGLDNASGSMSEFQSFTENFKTDAQRLELFRQKLMFLHEQFEAGSLTLASYESKVESATSAISDLVAEQEKGASTAFGMGAAMNEALEEMGRAMEKQAEDQRRIWDNLIDGVQGAWVTFFEDVFQGKGIKSVKDFLGRVKDLFFSLIAQIAAKWTAAKIFGGDFSLSFGSGSSGGGNIITTAASAIGKQLFGGATVTTGAGGGAAAAGGISGASVTGGAAGAGLGGGTAGVGISGASVTGGSAGAGLGGAGAGGGAAAGGSAAAAAAGYAAVIFAGLYAAKLAAGKTNREQILNNFTGFNQANQQSGPLGLNVGTGKKDKVGFFAGPNAGFAEQFIGAETGRPSFAVGPGGSRELGVTKGVVGEELIRRLGEAEKRFESLKRLGADLFADIGKDAKAMGNILRDGMVKQVELTELGMDGVIGKFEETKSGVMRLAEISSEQFGNIMEAVRGGELRMEALRGETMFNQREMDLLGDIGVDTATDIADGFAGAEQVSAAAMRNLREQGVSAFGAIRDAANEAASAAASVGGGTPRDPNVGGGGGGDAAQEVRRLRQDVRRDGRRRSFGDRF